jgi:hypothetical protein
MDEAKDVLWCGVQPLLQDFAERIAASDPVLRYSVESYSNDAFLLRGYASLRKTAVDNEIVVSVDATFRDGEIVLSADGIMEDGEVLADGPEAAMALSAMLSSSETLLADWLGRFEDFLASIEAVVRERAAAM